MIPKNWSVIISSLNLWAVGLGVVNAPCDLASQEAETTVPVPQGHWRG